MPQATKPNDNKANVERIAAQAMADEKVLQELLNGVSPDAQKSQVRETSSQALMQLSQKCPEALYPHWDYFVGLMKSGNGFSKYVAIYVIRDLVRVDTENRFEKALKVFYSLLDDESVMVASHAAGTSGAIAKAKPALQAQITKRLLDVDRTHFDASRKGLIKSYVITALAEFFTELPAKDQDKVIAFVQAQLDCPSPKTRKLAKAFLQKWTRRSSPAKGK